MTTIFHCYGVVKQPRNVNNDENVSFVPTTEYELERFE